jgi:hypothetical protein
MTLRLIEKSNYGCDKASAKAKTPLVSKSLKISRKRKQKPVDDIKQTDLLSFVRSLNYQDYETRALLKNNKDAVSFTLIDLFLLKELANLNESVCRQFPPVKTITSADRVGEFVFGRLHVDCQKAILNSVERCQSIINQLIVNQELILDAINWLKGYLGTSRESQKEKEVNVPAEYQDYYRVLIVAGALFIRNQSEGKSARLLSCRVIKHERHLYRADQLLENRAKVTLFQLNRMLERLYRLQSSPSVDTRRVSITETSN